MKVWDIVGEIILTPHEIIYVEDMKHFQTQNAIRKVLSHFEEQLVEGDVMMMLQNFHVLFSGFY